MPIRLLLVDDQASVRKGLRMRLALEPDLVVVGEAGDGVEALRGVFQLEPDVVVMDIAMPRMDGLAAAEALRTIAPACPVVMLTLHDNVATRERARQAGVAAFVGKQSDDAVLLAAIRQVAAAQG